ncbi:MAG: VIT1/CCC1 transporter family protein [Hyphomicrobiales bacterium]
MTLEHDHSTSAIRERLAKGATPNYLRDWIYGGIDGAVTTFAIVAGVIGAQLSSAIIIILGLANLLADGFSMAASNYSGTKTELDDLERLREIERRHIKLAPDGEREELRQILQSKGLKGHAMEEALEAIAANEETWINTMLTEEYGKSLTPRSPMKSALATFSAFIVCGAVPLLPFFTDLTAPFAVSVFMTAMVFFLIGAIKSNWSLAPWWRSGIETLVIGMLAAGAAFYVGYLLKGLT